MKVLHILNELKHSGAEVRLQLAYERFQKSGIESHILSTGNQVGDYAAVLRDTGYRIHHIPFRKRIGFLGFLIDIGKLLQNERFSAVHIHTQRAFIWYVLMARLADVRIIVKTFCSVFLFSSYLGWKKGRLWRKLSSKVFGVVNTAGSHSVVEVEKKRFDNECILIPNWTDVHRFRPPSEREHLEARRAYDLELDDFTIVTIGACTRIKNHLAVFRALKEANKYLERKKLVFLHVGTGPMLEEEQLYVRQHGIGEDCRFVGILNDVRPCLFAADAFVMTSEWEGLAVSALEAMSTGLPPILYNVYGLRDLLRGGKGGLLIEPNEERLAEALLLLNERPELRKRYGEEARQIILNTYSLEDSVDKFIQLYRGQKVG